MKFALNYWIALTVVNRPTAYIFTLFRSAEGNRDWNFVQNFCEKISRFHSIYITFYHLAKSGNHTNASNGSSPCSSFCNIVLLLSMLYSTKLWFLFSLFHHKAEVSKIFTVAQMHNAMPLICWLTFQRWMYIYDILITKLHTCTFEHSFV